MAKGLGVIIIIIFPMSSLPVLDTASYSDSSIPTSDSVQAAAPVQLAANIDPYTLNFSTNRTGAEFSGYNLFVLGQKAAVYNNSLIITDMDGNVIMDRLIGKMLTYDSMAEFVDPNTILVGTDDGPAFWNMVNDSFEQIYFKGHHEYEYNPNADTVFTFKRIAVEFNGMPYLYDMIYEVDHDAQVVWSLNTSTFIPPEWWCPFEDLEAGLPDITHSNSISYDADEDIIYYSSRNTNTFFKIDHATGEILWGLGEHGNFTLYDMNSVQKDSLFYHAHSVEPVDDDTFILFDNDYHNQEDEESRSSRILEITIDEETMTANESWSWAAPHDYYSAGWGDADRLPNGNRLGTFGYWHTTSDGITAGLLEVEPSGDLAWKLDFMEDSDGIYGTYRSERFTMTPTLSSPDDMFVMSAKDFVIPWEGWYNFRTKQDLPGTYQVLVDDVPMVSGGFTFEKYWQPANLTFHHDGLSDGLHNVTCVITNDFNQSTSDTVMVTVGPFYIERNGPVSIEKGLANSNIVWSGFTVCPLSTSLTLNGSVSQSGNWTGDDLTLDLNSLSPGVYNVSLTLSNNSEILYSDTFWVTVFPMLPPNIISISTVNEIVWGQGYIMSWNISDRSPRLWEIFLDGSQRASSVWASQYMTVNWELPLLLEDMHNVTFVAYDWVGLHSTHQVILTVIPPDVPIIASTPTPTLIEWRAEDTVFQWEVHGATQWTLWKNVTLFAEGIVSGLTISVPVDDWMTPEWVPGTYNLTMVVNDEDGNFDTATTIIKILIELGDPYADAVVSSRSNWYSDGENAIGAPDGVNATIFTEYGSGYLTLDMGEGEEIYDGAGIDFWVVASGGSYSVRVTSSLSKPMYNLGVFSGNRSLDLSGLPLEPFRYVRIDYFEGEFIQLDAIVARYYNVPATQPDPPVITGVDGLSIPLNTIIRINWTAYDIAPWTYEVQVDNITMQSGRWNGSDICYDFTGSVVGNHSVTLILTDIFMKQASDDVIVAVLGGASSESDILLMAIPLTLLAVGAVAIIYFHRRRRT